MGLKSRVKATVEDVTVPEEPHEEEKPRWKKLWIMEDGTISHVFGLPTGWFIVACIATSIAIILGAVLGTVVARRRAYSPPITGVYPANAPFREVLRSNFPDPALLRHNATWYVYGTNNEAGILQSRLNGNVKDLGAANVQMAKSDNFLNWTLYDQKDGPLPKLGEWVSQELIPAEADESVLVLKAGVWAPHVQQRSDGRFVLYYSAIAVDESVHCVGSALSDLPTGPFQPQNTSIACPVSSGGAIDPASFNDTDGTIYLAYKIDGNARGNGGECNNSVPPLKDTPILLQKMEPDGITPSGPPTTILNRTEEDGPLVEAPTIIRSEQGIYFLFFSSGCTRNPSYDLKYATSTNITGPYTRASEPLLTSSSFGLLAPGSASVWRDGRDIRMVFHARVYTDVGGIRATYISDLSINGTKVTLQAPS